MERHYSLEELDRYAADPQNVTDRAALEAHLDSCGDCRTALNDARAFIAELSAEEVWHFSDHLATAGDRRPLVDLANRIEHEDREAARMLRRPLVSPLRFVWANIPNKRRYRTGGVVRLLCRQSKTIREGNTLHARNLAETAAVIADALPDDYYPARGVNHLRGLAWKECANALRYLGDPRAALDALDRSARAYRRLISKDLEMASVEYVRATIFWKQQRFDEALKLVCTSSATFARLGDHERWVDARMLEGAILCDAHDGASAREIFMSLRDLASSDPVTAARLENNLANAYLELGDIGSASRHFVTGLGLFETLGLVTEVARARWRMAFLMLIAGNAVEAERRLRAARDECERFGLATDSALIQLDIVEALLMQNRRAEVLDLCADLVVRFTAAGMLPAALTAAAFVREAASVGKLTANQVRYVRAFLKRIEVDRAIVFLPPFE